MRVIRADVLGMCFGVRDALVAIDAVGDPTGVTIHGELVHNDEVIADLDRRGFPRLGEAERAGAIPTTPGVLITAHGISDRERGRLVAAGKVIHDATCPLVVRAHKAARRLKELGYFVVVIGKPGHVEVRGIVEDLDDFEVVADAGSVRHYDRSRIGIICQTTATAPKVAAVREAVARENPTSDVRFLDTVCRPTKDHQAALLSLIDRVEAMVVVGGRHSNNTRELSETTRARGLPVLQVESAADLDSSWLGRFGVVGLTAGTSTPDRTIDEVERAILATPPAPGGPPATADPPADQATVGVLADLFSFGTPRQTASRTPAR